MALGFALGLALTASPTLAQTFDIWPGVAPGSEQATQVEVTARFPGAGFPVVRNVTHPTLEVFRPAEGTATGAAVIIAPGGGFRYLTMEAEGTAVARMLAEHGVTAFVLKYRTLETPADNGAHWREFFTFIARASAGGGRIDMEDAASPAVADGLRALSVVRARAADWGVDPARVGMIGFSAGAKVTAGALLTDDPAARPAFAALIYGATFNDSALPADLPPIFLAVAGDDRLAAPAVTDFYLAAVRNGETPELHVYSKGGHGFGMNRQGTTSDFWTEDLLNWLRSQNLAAPQP